MTWKYKFCTLLVLIEFLLTFYFLQVTCLQLCICAHEHCLLFVVVLCKHFIVAAAVRLRIFSMHRNTIIVAPLIQPSRHYTLHEVHELLWCYTNHKT